MKVKNIMFSGVMAAILSATGANAAISVASQGYVDSKIADVETSVENTYLTQQDAADTYLTETQVQQEITNVVNAEDGAVATAQATATQAQSKVDALEIVVAGKADRATTLVGYGITDAYTKTEADAKFEEQAEATKKLTEAKAYTDTQIEALTDSLGGVGEDGEGTGLTGTVAAQGVRITSLEDKVGSESVANQIATALTTAQGYADTAKSDAVATAKAYSDSLASNYDAAGSAAAVEAKLADYTKTSDLNATFATDEELNAVDAKFANYTTTEDLTTTLDTFATKTALESEESARKAADEAATTALSGKQDTLTTVQLAAVNSGVTSDTVAQVATNTEEIAKKANADSLTLLATAEVPEACTSESNTCVLSMNTDGTFAWTPLTATPTSSN